MPLLKELMDILEAGLEKPSGHNVPAALGSQASCVASRGILKPKASLESGEVGTMAPVAVPSSERPTV